MSEVKISIVVPAYNAEKYLERCLDSLICQDLPAGEYEVIVVNDGSADRTGEILQEYAGRYAHLRYFTVENGGVSEARNLGCREARGKYLLFVDAGDRLQANVLQSVYGALEEEGLDILVMEYRYWDEQGELPKMFGVVREKKAQLLLSRVWSGVGFMQQFLPQVVWCSAYRTSFWRENHLKFLPIRHEDEEILPKIFYYARRVKYSRAVLYHYYKNAGSFMMNYDERAALYMLRAMESLDAFRRECVKEGEVSLFLKDLTARRLLSAFRKSILYGMPAAFQRELIGQMNARGLAPTPKKKGKVHAWVYRHSPSLFIAFYRFRKWLKKP